MLGRRLRQGEPGRRQGDPRHAGPGARSATSRRGGSGRRPAGAVMIDDRATTRCHRPARSRIAEAERASDARRSHGRGRSPDRFANSRSTRRGERNVIVNRPSSSQGVAVAQRIGPTTRACAPRPNAEASKVVSRSRMERLRRHGQTSPKPSRGTAEANRAEGRWVRAVIAAAERRGQQNTVRSRLDRVDRDV